MYEITEDEIQDILRGLKLYKIEAYVVDSDDSGQTYTVLGNFLGMAETTYYLAYDYNSVYNDMENYMQTPFLDRNNSNKTVKKNNRFTFMIQDGLRGKTVNTYTREIIQEGFSGMDELNERITKQKQNGDSLVLLKRGRSRLIIPQGLTLHELDLL